MSETIPPMHLTVVYARCSTDKQENSLDVQAANTRHYLAQHQLLTLPELTFAEEDVSGRKPIWKRPEGKRAIEAVANGLPVGSLSTESQCAVMEAGLVDGENGSAVVQPRHIVFAAVDRMARNTRDTLELFEWAQQHGITLHFTNLGGMNFNTGDPMGTMLFRFLVTVLGLFAEMEVEAIRGRILNTFTLKRGRGELCSSPAYGQHPMPSGRTRTRRSVQPDGTFADIQVPVMTWDVDPRELAVLHQMIRLQDEGLGCTAIANRLNKAFIPSKQGGKWTYGKVQKVLGNRFTQMVRRGEV